MSRSQWRRYQRMKKAQRGFKPREVGETSSNQIPMQGARTSKPLLERKLFDSENEKDPMGTNIKMLAQDPLEEVNLGDRDQKRVAYISAKLEPELKATVIKMLKENRDCFAWDYDEMPGLGRDLVELKLPIKEGKKPVKQT